MTEIQRTLTDRYGDVPRLPGMEPVPLKPRKIDSCWLFLALCAVALIFMLLNAWDRKITKAETRAAVEQEMVQKMLTRKEIAGYRVVYYKVQMEEK